MSLADSSQRQKKCSSRGKFPYSPLLYVPSREVFHPEFWSEEAWDGSKGHLAEDPVHEKHLLLRACQVLGWRGAFGEEEVCLSACGPVSIWLDRAPFLFKDTLGSPLISLAVTKMCLIVPKPHFCFKRYQIAGVLQSTEAVEATKKVLVAYYAFLKYIFFILHFNF